MAKAFGDAVRKAVYKRLETLPDVRLDASADDLNDAITSATRGKFSASTIATHAATAAKRTEKHSQGELKRIGVKRTDDPKVAKLITAWRSHMVDKVQTLEDDQRAKLKKILSDSAGRHVDSIKNDIEWQLDVTETTAAFIARNQVVQLYQAVNESRMQSAGISEYVWTTAGDERVSEAHDQLDGETFSFDDPPTDEDGNTGNPGLIRPNCRCQAYPVIPALQDDEAA